MIEQLVIIVFCLALLSFALHVQSQRRKRQIVAARKGEHEAQTKAIAAASRVAETAGIDSRELIEIMAEQGTTLHVTSDVWNVELPYGKWGEFPDPDGDPPPTIRGFWLDMVGRLIGVKMPKGSKYLIHKHDWWEILVGTAGLVYVITEWPDGRTERHRLGPGDVVHVPAKIKHAVAKAEEDAQFVCIWGMPEKK